MILSTSLRNATLLLLATGLTAFAHHAFNSEYDKGKALTLTVPVKSVDWKQPHVHLTLSVKNQAGQMEDWTLETASPDYLEHKGWSKATFVKGEAITVNAYRATDNSRTASARVITDAAGKQMQVCDPSEDGGPAK
jgi:hypothetical protein